MPLERGKSEYIVHSNVSEGDEDQSTEKDDASQKTGSNAQQNQLIADIAAKENEMVIMSRNLMLLVLFLSAIGMGMASYYLSVGTYKDFFVQSVRIFSDVGHYVFVVCSNQSLLSAVFG